MIPALELTRLRAQTPGLSDAVHLNHAGASLMPQAALDTIRDHLDLESRVGPMEAAAMVTDRLERIRRDAARLINAQSDEIAFMTSGSSAFGHFFTAMSPLKPGDRILVGRQEWGGNLVNYQRAAQRAGATVEVIPTHADGSVDAVRLSARLDRHVRLISLTWLPANGGLINDAEAIGRVAKAAGIPYFIDAGQALGQVPIDVDKLQCDVLKSAGRKHLRGPRGTALLYVRRAFLDHLEPAWVDVLSAPLMNGDGVLRSDARRFETSEAAVALLLGLGESIVLALALGSHNIAVEIALRAQALRERLRCIPGTVLHDLGGPGQSGLVSFNMRGHSPFALKTALAQRNIHVGANGVPYTPLDMQARGLDGVVRASVSYLNTDEDIERLAVALEQ
jgi:cysteine desulfurase/selenocysteine lyase